MKRHLKLERFYLLNNKATILIFMIVTYGCILPLCLISDDTFSKAVLYFKYLQQLQMMISLILFSFLYNVYVDKEYKELIRSLDRQNRLLYVMTHYVVIQCLLIPLYIVFVINDCQSIYYIGIYSLQLLFMVCMYYFLSQFIESSYMCLMILLSYILSFTTILVEFPYFNVFQMNVLYTEISLSYYVFLIGMSLICMGVGMIRHQ